MEFNSVFNLGPRVQIRCEGPGRTRQSASEECDINYIMAKYAKTGMVDHLARHGADYGFASSIDFHGAMNIVTKADQMFADLPAPARERFRGDPAVFLDFVQDESNLDEMIELGLAPAKVLPKPGPVEAGEGEPKVAAKPLVASEEAETSE